MRQYNCKIKNNINGERDMDVAAGMRGPGFLHQFHAENEMLRTGFLPPFLFCVWAVS